MGDGGTSAGDWPRSRWFGSSGSRAIPALAIAGVLALVGSVASCSGGSPVAHGAAAAPVATTGAVNPSSAAGAHSPPVTLAVGDPDGAHLRVTQDLTDCCYPGGHLSWLLVVDDEGEAIVQRQVRPLADPFPVVDVVLPAGAYRVVSAQQGCGATCAVTGDAVDRCEADVALMAGSTTYLTVGVDPGRGCAVVLAASPLVAPVADEVALPGVEVDCGHDASLAEASATGRNVVLSDARRCLVAAARRSASAWLQADEPAEDGSGLTAMVVYRLASDGEVSVYQVVDPAAAVWGWTRSTCAGLVPDDVRGFLAQRCAPPEAVPWVASA